MSFSTVLTMPPLSQPSLVCSRLLWERLVVELRERGNFGERESGAFLLGTRTNSAVRILQYVLYDDLDPHSLDRGIVHFDGRHYGALWEQCRKANLTVVADVHTHPFGPQQSPSDRAHPMIAAAGHIALILPRFAMTEFRLAEIGMYRYLGSRRWQTVAPNERAVFFRIDDSGGIRI